MTTKAKYYRLRCVLYDPSESTEPDKYMAEVPSFPNCVAWGDSEEETIDNLRSVVTETISVYRERGYELPAGFALVPAEEESYTEPRVLEVSV